MGFVIRLIRHALTGMLFLGISVDVGSADSSRAPVDVPTDAPIPTSFQTWSLFLVCNPTWLGDDAVSRAQMATLHSVFLGFGRSLGSKNAAIWFSTRAQHPEDYDADRGGDFCGTYGLMSNNSPYVVVTSTYPTESGAPGDFVAISLSGLSHNNTGVLLGQMADQIRASKLNFEQMDSDRYWRGWVQVIEDTFGIVGQVATGLHFEVDAKFLKVRYDGTALSQFN